MTAVMMAATSLPSPSSNPVLGLMDILLHPAYAIAFREFCHANFSAENLAFWLEAEDFSHLRDHDRLVRGPQIWSKFIKPGSPYEINIDANLTVTLRKQVAASTFTDRTFLTAQQYVWDLMQADTLPKFLKSDFWTKAKLNKTKSVGYMSRLRRTFSTGRAVHSSETMEFISKFQKFQKKMAKKGTLPPVSTFLPNMVNTENIRTSPSVASQSTLFFGETSSGSEIRASGTGSSLLISRGPRSRDCDSSTDGRTHSASRNPSFTSLHEEEDSLDDEYYLLTFQASDLGPLSKVLDETPLWVVYHSYLQGHGIAAKRFKFEEHLSTNYIKHFCDTIRHQRPLRHPNILMLAGAAIAPESLILATEYLPLSLSALVRNPLNFTSKTHPKPLFAQNILLSVQVAHTINFLHHQSSPVAHGDLCSSNVFLNDAFEIKLAYDGLTPWRFLLDLLSTNSPVPERLASWVPYHLAPEIVASLFPPSAASGSHHNGEPICSSSTASSTPTEEPSSGQFDPFTPRSHSSKALTRADSFSFGVLIWELLMARTANLPEVKNLSELNDAYRRGTRLPIPSTWCGSLRYLLTSCWSANPRKRPTFDEILGVSEQAFPVTIYDVMIDSLIKDRVGRIFWKTHWFDSDHVQWATFLSAFMSSYGITLSEDDRRIYFLKALLADSSGTVEISGFGRFLQVFGPLPTWPEFYTFPMLVNANSHLLQRPMPLPTEPGGIEWLLSRMAQLLDQTWFHGDLSTSDAERRLKVQPPGTFLVRFSPHEPDAYTLSHLIKAGKVLHIHIFFDQKQGYSLDSKTFAPTLVQLIDSLRPTMALNYACSGSPYETLLSYTSYPQLFPDDLPPSSSSPSLKIS